MQARLPAPFGSLHVHLDASGGVAWVDLDPVSAQPDVPEGFPASIREAFEAYLAGERARPDVPVGSVEATAFQRSVYEALVHVLPGDPITYGQLADRIGKPGAARAVGQALRGNPLPLVWPCHRVVASDGLGGFGGASGHEGDGEGKLAIKRWLLAHERSIAERRSAAELPGPRSRPSHP